MMSALFARKANDADAQFQIHGGRRSLITLSASVLSGPDAMETTMRKLLTFLIALAATVGIAASSFGGMMMTGVGAPSGGGGGCTNNIAVDGSGVSSAGGSTTSTVTLTTTHTNDFALIAIQHNAGAVTSVTDGAGLTWTLLGIANTTEVWSAFSTGILTSDVITITYNSVPAFDSIVAWGLTGTVTSSFFDPNGALPGTTIVAGTPLTLTTSNACDFLFAAYAGNSGTVTADAGFTLIPGSGGNFMGVEYKLVTATQSALSMTVGGTTAIKNGIGSAVKSN
jgi:hypothetical protein